MKPVVPTYCPLPSLSELHSGAQSALPESWLALWDSPSLTSLLTPKPLHLPHRQTVLMRLDLLKSHPWGEGHGLTED